MRDVSTDRDVAPDAAAIIGLRRNPGLPVIAAGVEPKEREPANMAKLPADGAMAGVAATKPHHAVTRA